jgi:hypothetical protein
MCVGFKNHDKKFPTATPHSSMFGFCGMLPCCVKGIIWRKIFRSLNMPESKKGLT